MTRLRTAALATVIGFLLVAVAWVVPASAASDCPDGLTQFKIDEPPSDGTYGDGTLEVQISNATESSFDWSSNIEVESVLVKGGTELQSNPGGTSGSASSPDNPNSGKPYGISHVSFCYSTGGGQQQKKDDGNEEKTKKRDDGPCDANPEMDGIQSCTKGDTEKRGGKKPCDANPEMDGTQPCTEGNTEQRKTKKPCDANPEMDGTQPCGEADTEEECDANPDMPGTQPCGEGDTVAGVIVRAGQRGAPETAGEVVAGSTETAGAAETEGAPDSEEVEGGVLPRTGSTLLPLLFLSALLIGSGLLTQRKGRD